MRSSPARAGLSMLLAALCLAVSATPALADDPTPSRSPTPPPQPTLSPTLSPEQLEAARERFEAMSLLARLEFQAERIRDERRYLADRRAEAERERAEIEIEIAALAAREAQRREVHRRLLQQAYRQTHRSPLEVLLETGSVLDAARQLSGFTALGDQERELVKEIRSLADERERARDIAAARGAEIVALGGTLELKESALAAMVERARRLAAVAEAGGDVNAAELAIVRELAEEAARAHAEAERLLSEISERSGFALPDLGKFVWPSRGAISQEFGPSALTLEPAATYRGVRYPHFHEGIDIAAPLGTPVAAIAAGRVAFVGHLSDGAMVVIVAHADGLTSLYGHLDDAAFRPAVRTGDAVEAGDAIGAIGLTGITTGPHLHFSVRRDNEPVDPRSLLPAR